MPWPGPQYDAAEATAGPGGTALGHQHDCCRPSSAGPRSRPPCGQWLLLLVKA